MPQVTIDPPVLPSGGLNPLFSTPQNKLPPIVDDDIPEPTSRLSEITPRRSLSHVVQENFSSSVRGVENFHIYLWILKDFAWAQDDYWMAIIFGSSAVVYCGLLIGIALYNRDVEETYMTTALTLWLLGNYWWMCGETGIQGDDDTNAPEAAYILGAVLTWLALYHIVLRPLGVIGVSTKMMIRYKQTGLRSRFSYFVTWRQYEHAHTLFWCAKDLSWNRLQPIPWIIFSVPTILIAVDFIYCTWKKGQVVDSAHYCAQLIWVMSNLTWAAGSFSHLPFSTQ